LFHAANALGVSTLQGFFLPPALPGFVIQRFPLNVFLQSRALEGSFSGPHSGGNSTPACRVLHPLTSRCPHELFNPIHGFPASQPGAVPLTIPNSSAHDLCRWSCSSSSPPLAFSVFPFGLPGISHSRGRLPPFRFQSLLNPLASHLTECRPHVPRSRFPAALSPSNSSIYRAKL
jgi:hypothetical protein